MKNRERVLKVATAIFFAMLLIIAIMVGVLLIFVVPFFPTLLLQGTPDTILGTGLCLVVYVWMLAEFFNELKSAVKNVIKLH